jgi:nucleotide-binding universal stress UspA family protein
MSPLKNLLAATDFSGPSRQAADRAARLAAATGARLQLMHALGGGALAQLQQWLGLDSSVEQTLVAQARQSLDAMAAELVAARGVAVEPVLVQGAVLEAVTLQAEAISADLVAVGALGADFMRRFVLGSTAERLLRKSRTPVLVVKQRAHEPYRRVLVAVDFSEWSTPLLDLARRVAPGAHLVLLSAYQVPFEGKLRYASVAESTIERVREQARQAATRQVHALAANAGLKPADWTPCIPYADPSLAIVEQEQELACDLIVVGKHGRNMAEDLLLGSVTKHVLTESAGDVLVSTARGA